MEMGQVISLREHRQAKKDEARYRRTREHIADELGELPDQLVAHALMLAEAGAKAPWDEVHGPCAAEDTISGELAATGDPRVAALMAAASAIERALDLLEG